VAYDDALRVWYYSALSRRERDAFLLVTGTSANTIGCTCAAASQASRATGFCYLDVRIESSTAAATMIVAARIGS
jgi:hypothetical protein